MAELLQVYKCEVCGNMVELINVGGGTLVCCGQPMKLLAANSTDAAKEKHVPMIEKRPDGYMVSVGSVAHPMEADHYIQWIELIASEGADTVVYRKHLKPGDKPEAFFAVKAPNAEAREYCNKHGLWKSQ
jgi:superoxide reductase